MCEIVWVGKLVEWVPACFIADLFFCMQKHPEWQRRRALYKHGIDSLGITSPKAYQPELEIMTEAAAQLVCDVLNATEREQWNKMRQTSKAIR